MSGLRVVAQRPAQTKSRAERAQRGLTSTACAIRLILLLRRRREHLTAVGFRDRLLRRLQTQQHQFEAVTNELHAIV
jgi:hypothetical protein